MKPQTPRRMPAPCCSRPISLPPFGPAHPAATTSATTTTSATRTTAATPKVATPAKTAKPATAATPATPKPAVKTTWPQNRPVAFTVPGARKEPLDEMPLPNRAQLLAHLARGASDEDERERLALALPERVDRRRREVRLVARSGSARDPRRGRSPSAAALGHRFAKRRGGAGGSRPGAVEVQVRLSRRLKPRTSLCR